MATNTTNYKLVKQGENEYYDVNIDNANLDKIDTEIKKVNDKVDSKPTTALGTSFDNSTNGMTATNVQKAIEENKTSILTLQNNDGNLAQLQTTNKTNLVVAINELFLSANSGKSTIATAVGSPLATSDTFSAMGTKIDTLTGKLATNLTSKGVVATASEKMSNLIDKVASIDLRKIVDGEYLNTLYCTTTTFSEFVIPLSIDFIPTRIVVSVAYATVSGSTFNNKFSVDSSIALDSSTALSFKNGTFILYCYIGNIKKESFSIFLKNSASSSTYSIGNPIKYTIIK